MTLLSEFGVTGFRIKSRDMAEGPTRGFRLCRRGARVLGRRFSSVQFRNLSSLRFSLPLGKA